MELIEPSSIGAVLIRHFPEIVEGYSLLVVNVERTFAAGQAVRVAFIRKTDDM